MFRNLLSPVLSVALAGCCGGGGCRIPSDFSGACSLFSSSGISGACQTALAVCGPDVRTALRSLPGCCSGICSGSLATAMSGAGFNPNNLVGSCLGQAQLLFSNGIPGLINIMQGVNAFCQTSFDANGIIVVCKNLNLPAGDIGFNLNSIKNICTGGLTAEFGTIGANFKEFCNNLSNIGTMIEPRNLSNCFTAEGLISNLCNQGFGQELFQQLEKVGINSLQEITGANDKLLMQALRSVPIDVVNKIVEQTGFRVITGKLENLTEVITHPAKYLGESANQLISNSVEQLQIKLSNVLGTQIQSQTFGELGQALSKITEPITPLLSQSENVLSAWANNFPSEYQTRAVLGTGSGIFNNPTIGDVIGVAAGIGFTTKIRNMISIQERLLTTPEGISLKLAIDSAIASPVNDATNAAAIIAASAAFVTPSDPIIGNELAAAQQDFDDIGRKLLQEKANLDAAAIVVADSKGNVTDIMSWVSNLHTVHDDPSQLGYADYIRAISDNSVTGEAIRAGIVEGKNLAIYQNLGVSPSTSISAATYAQALLNQVSGGTAGLNCCPSSLIAHLATTTS